MIAGFSALEETVRSMNAKRIAVAMAEEEDVLSAVLKARDHGLAQPFLVGNSRAIKTLAAQAALDLSGCELIDANGEQVCAQRAVELVVQGTADCLMKGKVPSAVFLKAILHKECGISMGRQLSHIALYEWLGEERIVLFTDWAIAIDPDLLTKQAILDNAVVVAHRLGCKNPRVAVVSAIEQVNPRIAGTCDAALLAKMSERGQITGCVVDGPLALDNALSAHSCLVKGIASSVEGKADIVLLPNLEAGNILYKALTLFSSNPVAGLVMGARVPVVMTSRADTMDVKLRSILAAVAVS